MFINKTIVRQLKPDYEIKIENLYQRVQFNLKKY